MLEIQNRFFGLSLLDVRSLAYELAERNGLNHPLSKSQDHAIENRFYELSLLNIRSQGHELAERNGLNHSFSKRQKLADKD